MRGRDPGEPHRAATPLELFSDLVFIVAVALAAELVGMVAFMIGLRYRAGREVAAVDSVQA
jgi:low temperature requirement protein LtrA